jgi:uncharacterized repeat protein (TIGR03803 family)
MAEPGKRRWIPAVRPQTAYVALALAVSLLVVSPTAQAQFKMLYTFSGGTDGGRPEASVIKDAKGNLYGTTFWGGNLSCNSGNGCGVVFKLTPAGKEIVLHSFAGGQDGAFPSAALLADAQGNLYGTTTAGGAASGCLGSGCGTIFKVDTKGTETVLYRFTGGTDGGEPSSALTVDSKGNLLGTTSVGGNLSCSPPSGCGVVYAYDRVLGKEIVLMSFAGGADGEFPTGERLGLDNNGSVFGTTQKGGDSTCDCGVVFKLTKSKKEIVLHSFKGGATDGSFPLGGVTLDTTHNLYGTTALGGANGQGVLFKISVAGSFSVLHSFGTGGTDGTRPYSGVNVCSDGSVLGNTTIGGTMGFGTIWKVAKNKKETVLYNFDFSFGGGVPVSGFTWTHDGDGSVSYGTASEGGNINGKNGSGTVHSYDSDSREVCHH